MRHILFTIAFVLSGAAAQADDLVDVASDDAQMHLATTEAQETLPLFFGEVLASDGMACPEAYLKVGFDVTGAEAQQEHIWIAGFHRTGDNTFAGRLANEPVYLKNLVAGDEVTFTAAQISDWVYMGKDGLMYGSYTTRLLIDRMLTDEAAEVRASLSVDPIPNGWN